MMFALVFALCMPLLCTSWTVKVSLDSSNFFDGTYWNFITQNDPTHGYVNYVDKSTAQADGYISTNNGEVYIGCDHTNVAGGRGRNSVRLESKERYNYGLFILYLKHMPTGCGTWPAWWTYGPNWPNSGEIDVIEGVDVANNDLSSLHTSNGCDMSSAAKNYSGSSTGSNCEGNSGCGIKCNNGNSFGGNFNNKGGGLYAMQWTSEGIKSWMWNEGNIPSDAQGNNPNPDGWGLPYAAFPFGNWCPSSHFANHVVVFDLTFCGDWDGAVFGNDCPGKGSCNSYVQNNPSAFKEAYWNVNFMKVFQ